MTMMSHFEIKWLRFRVSGGLTLLAAGVLSVRRSACAYTVVYNNIFLRIFLSLLAFFFFFFFISSCFPRPLTSWRPLTCGLVDHISPRKETSRPRRKPAACRHCGDRKKEKNPLEPWQGGTTQRNDRLHEAASASRLHDLFGGGILSGWPTWWVNPKTETQHSTRGHALAWPGISTTRNPALSSHNIYMCVYTSAVSLVCIIRMLHHRTGGIYELEARWVVLMTHMSIVFAI